ncbi:MAG: alpha/beta hydrolase [Prochlorotrichaceae cyanobacterium]
MFWRSSPAAIQVPLITVLRSLGLGLTGAIVTSMAWALPSWGAERLQMTIGSLQFSLPVADLEAYATTGKVSPELGAYARTVSPEDFVKLRKILQRPANLNPDAISRIAYTPMGEVLLQRVGAVLQTGRGENGGLALRSSLLESARSSQGITLITVLQNFPDPEIRVNLDAALVIVKEALELYYDREALLEAIQNQSLQEIRSQSILASNYAQLPDLRTPGALTWKRQSLDLVDSLRQRAVPTDIYWPDRADPAPVVFISHGVGGTLRSFDYLAEHLASYGFIVIVPEHVGSNAKTVIDFFRGLTEPVPQEAIDRPWDITFVLNLIEHYSKLSPAWRSRINFEQIGIVGQSFGGYTALALGGATLNFQALDEECLKPEPNTESLNASLLLQCNTNLLSHQAYILRDPRIKAVIAINPLTSHIFGQTGLANLQVPALIVASGDDIIAPAGPEQLYPFTWLGQHPRHLAVLAKGTHFSTISLAETQSGVFPLPSSLLGPDPAIAHRYLQGLSVAFFRTYLQQNPFSPIYLQAAYGEYLSEAEMPLSLLQGLQAETLDRALQSQN